MKNYVQLFFQILVLLTCNICFSFAQEKVNYEELPIEKSFCFNWNFVVNVPQYERDKGRPYLDNEYVIDSQESYLDFQKKAGFAKIAACQSFEFPLIDFSQKTLLVKYTSASCAARGFDRQVVKNNEKKEINYSIKTIKERIACSGPGLQSMNFITIPKIPKDYKVVFFPKSDNSGFQSYTCQNGKMVARDWNGNIVQPKNGPPPGGGVFGVQMDCGGDMIQKLPMDEKKLMIESGAANIPPPCPEGTHLQGQYCAKGGLNV